MAPHAAANVAQHVPSSVEGRDTTTHMPVAGGPGSFQTQSTSLCKEVMIDTRNQNWIDWLEAASQQDLYIANKYISSEPPITPTLVQLCAPMLMVYPALLKIMLRKQLRLLSLSFHPSSQVPQNAVYLEPFKGIRFFYGARIRQMIRSLSSPFKAPGPDKIPNIVLMKCIEALIDHLFFIYRAVFELGVYHPIPHSRPP